MNPTIRAPEIPDDHKALDQIRRAYANLKGSIAIALERGFLSEQESVEGTGLPAWNSTNQTIHSISKQCEDITKLMETNSGFLRSAHVHPNAAFPWFNGGPMIPELLRRIPDNETVLWIDNARKIGKALDAPEKPADAFTKSTMSSDEPMGKMSGEDWTSLWDFAAPEGQEILTEVWTGQPVEEEEEEEEDEEEAEDENNISGDGAKAEGKRKVVDIGPPMPMEDLLRFISSGGTLGVGGPGPAGSG